MARRWKILIFIGLFVAITDQWTKFLAVKHLTPGMLRAHSAAVDSSLLTASAETQKKALAELSLMQELGYFYGSIRQPCSPPGTVRCPTERVIDGFWNFKYVENPGAAWGLFAGARESLRVPFFLLISVLAIGFIISFFRKLPDNQLLFIVSLSLVFGGAIGNLIDRLHLSYVIDFIDWYIGTSHWPTFNVADAGITSGVVLMLIQWIRDWNATRAAAGRPAAEKSSAGGAP